MWNFDELTVQFYRSEVPCSNNIFTKLPSYEFTKKDTVVEHIEKPEMLPGGRIHLLSLPKVGKLV